MAEPSKPVTQADVDRLDQAWRLAWVDYRALRQSLGWDCGRPEDANPADAKRVDRAFWKYQDLHSDWSTARWNLTQATRPKQPAGD